jgi:GNAT superfamily N-acetyltransferase
MTTEQIAQAHMADDIEAAAYRDMYAAAPNTLVQALNLQSMQIGESTLLMANGIPDPVFSRVIGLGNNGAISDADVDAVIAAYRAAGIKGFWIHVNPVLAPADLIPRLERVGFKAPNRRAWAKMIRGATSPEIQESKFDIRPTQVSERAAVATAIASAFGMPPPFSAWINNMAAREKWTLIGAFDANEPVGGGLLFIEKPLAWLGLGGVLPQARGHNVHRAIMMHRIALAIEGGCTHVVTETGEPINNEPNPSLRNMYRCGFTRVCSRLNYALNLT